MTKVLEIAFERWNPRRLRLIAPELGSTDVTTTSGDADLEIGRRFLETGAQARDLFVRTSLAFAELALNDLELLPQIGAALRVRRASTPLRIHTSSSARNLSAFAATVASYSSCARFCSR